MFISLHELAKKATLMITIAAEGDDQMRVNVTPVPFDTKAKANLPQPLSLVASPAEFDADFAAALLTWHAPKRSLIEQAQAAGGAPAAAPALPAPKSESKNEKPGRKSRSKAGASEEPAPAQATGEAAGEAVAGADQVVAESAPARADELPAGSPTPSAGDDTAGADSEEPQQGAAAQALADQVVDAAPVDGQEPVDKFTLDLF